MHQKSGAHRNLWCRQLGWNEICKEKEIKMKMPKEINNCIKTSVNRRWPCVCWPTAAEVATIQWVGAGKSLNGSLPPSCAEKTGRGIKTWDAGRGRRSAGLNGMNVGPWPALPLLPEPQPPVGWQPPNPPPGTSSAHQLENHSHSYPLLSKICALKLDHTLSLLGELELIIFRISYQKGDWLKWI